MNRNYDDIINMPHHVSAKRKHMSMTDRAAQFSPFAALTGYDDVVSETARLTSDKPELDETEIAEINRKLAELQEHIAEQPRVTVTYFVPDKLKSGGKYVTVTDKVKKIQPFERVLILEDGCIVPFGDIINIECQIGQQSK
ncbi:MAG: YolD-like family protein [Firmicutes bacterium]|nr:YolD-like family protein [Bacillota bacterium]